MLFRSIGRILKKIVNPNLALISDDAGQFDVLIHALCWVHTERIFTSLNTVSDEQAEIMKKTLDEFWELFKEIHAYKREPSNEKRKKIEIAFDELSTKQTNYPSLDKACKSLQPKKQELLMVLNLPEIPLSNNISESDIRDYKKIGRASCRERV